MSRNSRLQKVHVSARHHCTQLIEMEKSVDHVSLLNHIHLVAARRTAHLPAAPKFDMSALQAVGALVRARARHLLEPLVTDRKQIQLAPQAVALSQSVARDERDLMLAQKMNSSIAQDIGPRLIARTAWSLPVTAEALPPRIQAYLPLGSESIRPDAVVASTLELIKGRRSALALPLEPAQPRNSAADSNLQPVGWQLQQQRDHAVAFAIAFNVLLRMLDFERPTNDVDDTFDDVDTDESVPVAFDPDLDPFLDACCLVDRASTNSLVESARNLALSYRIWCRSRLPPAGAQSTSLRIVGDSAGYADSSIAALSEAADHYQLLQRRELTLALKARGFQRCGSAWRGLRILNPEETLQGAGESGTQLVKSALHAFYRQCTNPQVDDRDKVAESADDGESEID
jgi:hypothetical protein